MGGASYQYDGEGRRTQQTVSIIVTKYLLDIQPGLAVVLSQTEGSDVTRFVHAPRGIHARQDASSDWHWTAQDGLGTVRMETNNSAGVEGAQNLDPFGNLIGLNGTIGKLLQDLPRHHPEYQIQIMQVSNLGCLISAFTGIATGKYGFAHAGNAVTQADTEIPATSITKLSKALVLPLDFT